MKLAWISEQPYTGYIDPMYPNQRIDLAWQIGLKTYHHNWAKIIENPTLLDEYEAAIFVIPKSNPQVIPYIIDIINKTPCTMIMMQEGPCWYWQEWSAPNQIHFFNLLKAADGILTHGDSDKRYYEGIAGRKCYVLPTMYNQDYLATIKLKTREEGTIMVGGNAGTWYSGEACACVIRDNPIINKVVFPTMGRKKDNEEILMSVLTNKEIEYLPYLNWTEFMQEISRAKYAIHLMPAAAAGTFQLNCAMAGIPCIGNYLTDTQKLLFPDLTCEVTDLVKAKSLLTKLTTDKDFYDMVCEKANKNLALFSHKVRIPEILKIIQEITQQ